MKPIIIKSKIITKLLSIFISVSAITLAPFIIANDNIEEYPRWLNHEQIHVEQQVEMLVVPFYLLYGLFYLKNRLKGMDSFDAYRQIPFEREAYANDQDLDYLENRKHYAWFDYV